MQKRSGTFNEITRSIIDLVTGNPIHEDVSPIGTVEKNPTDIFGRPSRLKDEKTRTEKPSVKERATRARWKK